MFQLLKNYALEIQYAKVAPGVTWSKFCVFNKLLFCISYEFFLVPSKFLVLAYYLSNLREPTVNGQPENQKYVCSFTSYVELKLD